MWYFKDSLNHSVKYYNPDIVEEDVQAQRAEVAYAGTQQWSLFLHQLMFRAKLCLSMCMTSFHQGLLFLRQREFLLISLFIILSLLKPTEIISLKICRLPSPISFLTLLILYCYRYHTGSIYIHI